MTYVIAWGEAPFISHTHTSPCVAWRQTRSALPSPFRSPDPCTSYAGSTVSMYVTLSVSGPFMSQSHNWPFAWCRHRMSDLPSPL